MTKMIWIACLTAAVAAGCNSGKNLQQDKPARREASCFDAPQGGGKLEQKIVQLQKHVGENRQDLSAVVAIGQLWVRKARTGAKPELYANAEACAQVALELDSKNTAAITLRGMALINAHRFREARALAKDVIAREQADSLIWGLLSDAELELGNLDAAVEAAQQMVDLKPSMLSYGRAAHLRWLTGDAKGAKELYQEAIRMGQYGSDREPAAWMIVQAALLFWHEGDHKGADAGFDLALTKVVDYAPALAGKGRAALQRGDYAAAARWLERALEREELAETAWLLGDAYTLGGKRDAADAAYARVERIGREHDPRTLALFYATKDRNGAEAVKLARAELSERADHLSKDALAWALYRASRLDEAKRLSQQAIAAGTPDARMIYHAGVIALASGDAERGRELMRKALKLNPRFDPLLTTELNDATAAL